MIIIIFVGGRRGTGIPENAFLECGKSEKLTKITFSKIAFLHIL